MRERGKKGVMTSTQDVTHLLRAWSEGDDTALEQLVPLVETELHRLARAYMSRERRSPAHTSACVSHPAAPHMPRRP